MSDALVDQEDADDSLRAIASAFSEALISRVPDLEPLVWRVESFEAAGVLLVADVIPTMPYPAGPAVTVLEPDEVRVAIGPTEFGFFTHDGRRGVETAADTLEAFLKRGALVEVRKRFRSTRTDVTVPISGEPHWTLRQYVEFEGFQPGTHAIPPPSISVAGSQGAQVKRTLGEVAVGSVKSGPLRGARVSLVEYRGWMFEWLGPEPEQFTDSYYDSPSDVIEVFGGNSEEVDWSWVSPRFDAWMARGARWNADEAVASVDTATAVATWFDRIARFVRDETGRVARREGSDPLSDLTLYWPVARRPDMTVTVGHDHAFTKHAATINVKYGDEGDAYLLVTQGEVTAVLFEGVVAEPWDSRLNDWVIAGLRDGSAS